MPATFTAHAPSGVKSWDRIRFQANLDDYRPIKWPPTGPYWCSGFNDRHSIVVAYVPAGSTDEDVRKLWTEAKNIDRMQTTIPITYSDRFPKPDWWKD